MAKARKRPAADRAIRESEAETQSVTASNHNRRIPPGTPDAIARSLDRVLRRLDDLADAGVKSVSFSDSMTNSDSEPASSSLTTTPTTPSARRRSGPCLCE